MFNQMEYDLKQLIYDRPTFQEMYEGYGKGGASDVPERVTMLYANGDGRTINVGWKKQTDLTNLSHYLLQVSEDEENWYALGFDGEWFSGEPFIGGYYSERFTIVYDHHIAHTRIPYNNGAVRKLYYRAALVTRNGIITGWSDPIQGNTFFVEQDDIRPEGQYVYNMDGSIDVSGEALYGTYYVGSGEIASSGVAATEAGFDYVYTPSGSMTMSGTATLYYDGFTYSSSGSTTASGAATTLIGSIIFGTEKDSNIVASDFDVIKQDSTHNVLCYRDSDTKGKGRRFTISDGDIGTISTAYTFSNSATEDIESTYLDDQHFVVIYSVSGIYYAQVGYFYLGAEFSNISYGTAVTFNGNNFSHVDRIDDTHFVLAYRNSSEEGKAVIGTIANDDEITLGTEYTFSTPTAIHPYSVNTLSTSSIQITYLSYDGSTNTLKSVIGTISGGVITFGSEYTVTTTGTNAISTAFDSTHFIVAYADSSDSYKGTCKVGVVSGTTITFGSEYIFSDYTFENLPYDINTYNATTIGIAYRNSGSPYYGRMRLGYLSNDDEMSFIYNDQFKDGNISNITLTSNTTEEATITYYDVVNTEVRIITATI